MGFRPQLEILLLDSKKRIQNVVEKSLIYENTENIREKGIYKNLVLAL